MKNKPTKILVFGAHPDDADLKCGGTAVLWSKRGDVVKFISVTNGDAGHQTLHGAPLADRRGKEAAHSGQIAGIEYILLDNHDGELEPTLENRKTMIREIRKFQPDLVLTHRPNDYHPDHRYTSVLVQDAMYMVTVPHICPEVPHLMYNPCLGYFSDKFTKPLPFNADVVINIDPVLDTKLEMLCAHESQFFEWLPYNSGDTSPIPTDLPGRKQYIQERWGQRWMLSSERSKLEQYYPAEVAAKVQHVESFEISEHGADLSQDDIKRIFPF